MVHRFVQLSLGGIDSKFAEQWIHTECSRFIGDDWDNVLSKAIRFHQTPHQPNKDHRRADFEGTFRAVIKFCICIMTRCCKPHLMVTSFGQKPTQFLALVEQVFDFIRIITRLKIGQFLKFLITKWQVHVITHELEYFLVGFLFPVRRVSPSE